MAWLVGRHGSWLETWLNRLIAPCKARLPPTLVQKEISRVVNVRLVLHRPKKEPTTDIRLCSRFVQFCWRQLLISYIFIDRTVLLAQRRVSSTSLRHKSRLFGNRPTDQRSTIVEWHQGQHWIQHLLSRFNAMKADTKNPKTPVEITAELFEWVMDNREKIYSGFMTTEGGLSFRSASSLYWYINNKGFDPTKDTPVEILHTILLGIVKYIWHNTHTSWSLAQTEVYTYRLQATNTDALSIHAIRANYIMQYAGSLIGRQFKTLAQTNIFHVRGIVSDKHFAIWRAVGELSALLWFPEIRNLHDYCVHFSSCFFVTNITHSLSRAGY